MTDWTVHDDGPLPGFADFIPADRDLSDAEIEGIASAVAAADLPVHATLGAGSAWAALVRSFSRRTLVRELPVQQALVPWLEVHSPPVGEAVVRLQASAASQRSVLFNVFGSGFGRGRRLRFTAGSESGPRTDCVTYAFRVMVKPRVYRRDEHESVEVSVQGITGLQTDSRPRGDCPWCSRLDRSDDDPLLVPEPVLDLRRDSSHNTVMRALELEEETSIEAGFRTPSSIRH